MSLNRLDRAGLDDLWVHSNLLILLGYGMLGALKKVIIVKYLMLLQGFPAIPAAIVGTDPSFNSFCTSQHNI